jgi:hypothetical protein
MMDRGEVDNATGPKSIRVGILCAGTALPSWQAECVRTLVDSEGVRVCLMIIEDTPPAPETQEGAKRRRMRQVRTALWDLHYHHWVERHARALRPVDMTAALAGIETLRCRTVAEEPPGRSFPDEVIRTIRKHRLDVVLQFSSGNVKGDILSAARFGIWAFHHGDLDRYRGGPACFWEMFHGDKATGCVLHRLTEHPGTGVALRRGWFRTDEISYTTNLDAALLGTADWPARLCRELRAGNGRQVNAEPVDSRGTPCQHPTNRQFLAYLWRISKNFVLRKASWFFRHDQWNVGLVDQQIHTFLDPNAVHRVQWLPTPPRHRFLADPFGFRRNGTTMVLAEDFDYRTRKGTIAILEYRNGKVERTAVPTIDRAAHMSYPYVVDHNGEVYCVPEASEEGGVHLFRAVRLPDQWEWVATLIDRFPAVDSTIFRHGGRWWLFCIARGSIPWTRLYAWHALELMGPWSPHAANPIKTDVRSSRPGGTPFVHGGALYRPAQDCSEAYGAAIALNRILRLTPDEFEEEVVTRIRPDAHGPFPRGIHTLSAVGDQTLVDGKRYVFAAAGFRYALRTQFRSVARLFVADRKEPRPSSLGAASSQVGTVAPETEWETHARA